ncbi:Stage II sporulation protein E (SpoIIE) [Geodermatophilus telluris]|uniref:Stage II sporulation protein E (SpoIIE) n=1 Tax=Geodermatophilus telluris TaxID=1190417 RepID=A0A1G6UKV4_9ACTN|nr:PP2C family protein-serine/threonine phosphatase [Geodermatophilus telluris]SDD41874.1 Stage II sporulation protein E (SpoIIE) [Geodermatophilus telluris]
MDRAIRTNALPAGLLGAVTVLDLVMGPQGVLIGLLAAPPLVAASVTGRRATAVHGALALLTAALLGIHDGQYTGAAATAQAVRLLAVTGAGVLAVATCRLRLRREAALARMTAEAATTQAELATAEALQQHLLGPPPAVPHRQTAARYLPAVRSARIGGDWYDAFPAPGDATVLVVGDVAGHDARAAAAMAEVRGMLRAVAATTATLPGPSPARVLDTLDHVLARLGAPALVTAVVAVLSPTGNGVRLCWSNAGHPPPVLARGDGTVRLLERRPERLLGVEPGSRRTDADLPLEPGDTLLLYTDGLVERRDRTLDEGTDWLLSQLRGRADEPLDAVVDGLLAGLAGTRHDDVALLAVRLPR